VQVAVAGPANALWLTCWGGVAEYSWLAISRSADITDALVRASTIVDSPPSGFARNLPGVQPEQLVVTSATDATVLMGFTTPLTAPAGLYETDDGGQSWHATWPVTSLNGAFGGDVDFISATDGWATVPNDGPGVLLHTTDAGATWTTA
jgi:hypothetical protein